MLARQRSTTAVVLGATAVAGTVGLLGPVSQLYALPADVADLVPAGADRVIGNETFDPERHVRQTPGSIQARA